jgi:hypothetical protein
LKKFLFDQLLPKKGNKTSFYTGFFLFALFTIAFTSRINNVVNSSEPKCLTAYDGFGYYSYLPAVFIYKDLSFKEWPEKLQSNYCQGAATYQFHYLSDGSRINIYQPGLSYVQLPAFLIAHLIAQSFGFQPDGMSLPYHVLFFLNALFFVALGIVFVRRTLHFFFNDLITSFTLILVFLGTNIFINFYLEPTLTHLYLFTLNSAFIYHTISYQRNGKTKNLIFSALLFGLTTAIRPTQVIWGIIPLFLFFINNRNFWPSIKILLLYPLSSFLWNVPQLFYWKYYGGSWFMVNLHNESIVFSDPKILDFLFSFKKGWLLYTPLFLLIPFGLYRAFTNEARLSLGISLLTLLSVYIFSSWECWWFAESFGSRVMQETYPVLAILVGFVLTRINSNKMYKYSLLSVTFLILGLNLLHSIQFKTGVIHNMRNTKDHYMSHFGVINSAEIDQSLLEMDRSDTTWITNLLAWKGSLSNQKGYSIEKVSIPIKQLNFKFSCADEYKGNYSRRILSVIPTDEAKLTLTWDYESSDTISTVNLVFLIEGNNNPYNYIVTPLHPKDSANRLVFNLPNIRHREDQMKIYLWNPNRIEGNLSNVKIKFEYLNRNN